MEDKPRLYTTHCSPHARPRQIGRPAIINGKLAIAYVSGNERLESYLLWDDAQEIMKKDNLPTIKAGF